MKTVALIVLLGLCSSAYSACLSATPMPSLDMKVIVPMPKGLRFPGDAPIVPLKPTYAPAPAWAEYAYPAYSVYPAAPAYPAYPALPAPAPAYKAPATPMPSLDMKVILPMPKGVRLPEDARVLPLKTISNACDEAPSAWTAPWAAAPAY